MSDQRVMGVVRNARSENPNIRAAAASSPVLPINEQARLVHDEDEGVRCWLARNQEATWYVLEELSKDPSVKVRAYVAWNPATHLETIKLLAEDTNGVVALIAENVLDTRSQPVLW